MPSSVVPMHTRETWGSLAPRKAKVSGSPFHWTGKFDPLRQDSPEIAMVCSH